MFWWIHYCCLVGTSHYCCCCITYYARIKISFFTSLLGFNNISFLTATQWQRFSAKDNWSNAPPPSWRARRSVVAGRISVPTCCFLHNWADNFSRWRNDCKWLLSKWVKIKVVLGFVYFSAFLYLNLQMSNCFDRLKRVALVSRWIHV